MVGLVTSNSFSGATRRRFLATGVALATLMLGGCALTGAGKVVDLYDLSAPTLERSVRGGTRRQILITEPLAVKAFNTDQIAIRTSEASLGYISGSRWTDTMPKLVQARLVETFQRSGRVGAVGTPGEGLFINYSVRLNIYFFGLDTESGRRARVEFGAKILNEGNGRVIATKSFTTTAPAGADTEGVVSALDRAFAQATSDLATWMFSKI